jgi:ribosomal protein S18 acetylase RimI-like enzyme
MTRVHADIEVASAATPAEVDEARGLFQEYAAAVGIDLEFQGFAQELRDLPGAYVPPQGCLLLARVGRRLAGCVAVRPLNDDCCELKRLYVRPEFRGAGAGRALAVAAIERARSGGYTRMRLDTIPSMTAARALYSKLGFLQVEPYRFNPVSGTSFMELALDQPAGGAALP